MIAEKSWDQKVEEALDAIDALYDDPKVTDTALATTLEALIEKCEDLLDEVTGYDESGGDGLFDEETED